MVDTESIIYVLTCEGMKKCCSYIPTKEKQLRRQMHDCSIVSRLAFSETPITDICTYGVYGCVYIQTYTHAKGR
jgi:hypothetical protein